MALPFELTAENVVDYAKKNGIQLKRGAVHHDFPRLCVLATLFHAIHGESFIGIYSQSFLLNSGLNFYARAALEAGFEDYPYNEYFNEYSYWVMGQKIYEMTIH